MCLAVGLRQVRAERDPARVGVLHDGDARLAEVEGGPPGSVGVDVVVVRHGLAVQHLRRGDASRLGGSALPGGLHVQRGSLVRVLAVPQHALAPPDRARHVWPARLRCHLIGCVSAGEPGRDGRVVSGGSRVRLCRQPPALFQAEPSGCQCSEHLRVARRACDDGHCRVVLRRCPDHRRPADVDLLDGLRRARSAGHGLLERVQARDQQLERLDAQLGKLGAMSVLGQIGEQAGVHLRVQRLDPAIQALGKPGELLNRGDRQASRSDGGGGAAGRHDLDAGVMERGRQVGKPGLVVDADQRPLDGHSCHESATFITRLLPGCRCVPSGPGPTSLPGPSGRRCRRRAFVPPL